MSNPLARHIGHGSCIEFESYDDAAKLCILLDMDDDEHFHRPVKLGGCWRIRMSERDSGLNCGEI